jgi:hypothetical protein
LSPCFVVGYKLPWKNGHVSSTELPDFLTERFYRLRFVCKLVANMKIHLFLVGALVISGCSTANHAKRDVAASADTEMEYV